MDPEESISIEPNRAIKDTLSTVDAGTLTEKLGTPSTQAEDAAKSIRAAMSLTQKRAPLHPPKYLSRNRSLAGLHYHASASELPVSRIDPAAVPRQDWIIRFGRDGPKFQQWSPEEAAVSSH